MSMWTLEMDLGLLVGDADGEESVAPSKVLSFQNMFPINKLD